MHIDNVKEKADPFLFHIISQSNTLNEKSKELIYQYYDTSYERGAIALLHHLPLSQMMFDIFNNTGDREAAVYYTYKKKQFSYQLMNGICDDYYGERYCKFGAPFVIRVYIQNYDPIPSEVFNIADWNYMSDRKDGFLGYIYGSFYKKEIYVAGLQSDIGQRYSFLFGKKCESFYNNGQSVIYIENDLIVDKFHIYIPYIRNYFQRDWISILMQAVVDVCYNRNIEYLNLLQYTRDPEEEGYIVDRIYSHHFSNYVEGQIFVEGLAFNRIAIRNL